MDGQSPTVEITSPAGQVIATGFSSPLHDLAGAVLVGIWRVPGRGRLCWSAAAVLLPLLGPLLWWSLGRPRDGSGRPTRISGINFDITERKKAEEIRIRSLEEARMARNIQINLLPKSNPERWWCSPPKRLSMWSG